MTIPSRFAIEYPLRALSLIKLFEEEARKSDLTGSFALLAAAAVLTIPYERMKASHFLHEQSRDSDLAQQIKQLQTERFLEASFWCGDTPGVWRQSRVVGPVEVVDAWRDEDGKHPFADDANTVRTRKADEVIRVLRNALAHGNIIYLDGEGREITGRAMAYMAFLSRYEESKEERDAAETYRVVIVSAEDFLRFVKSWAAWVSRLPLDYSVSEAA